MDFLEFYKELEAEFLGAGAKLMGIQLLQLELRLGKSPSRCFRPVKSAENLWQFWASYSLRVSLAHDGCWSKSPFDSTDHATKHLYTQEEGIDYDKVFAPVARIEANRLFLAYASFKDFVVYQMDEKWLLSMGKIEKSVMPVLDTKSITKVRVISKITRKPSKTGKHRHEERKSTKEARDAKPKAGKVKKSKLWSTLGQFSHLYTQEEGIDYDEVFAPVARIEANRLFLAYASFKDFVVYQMDVKSAFIYGKIEEEVYVCQPLGFEDPDFPDRVYKVEKVLYGLHQAPRAWYETLSTYLLDNEFQRGKFDKTLFIKRYKGDILLVQMSSMGELTFFLGLQVQQKHDGIFISKDKYVGEILKKFGFTEVKTASTPMETQKPLLKDEDGEEVDVHMYRSMIGSLMYLTASRPDIMFAVCTDISKITRKPSKTGKHGHEERKSTKEARDAKPKAGKVKKSKLLVRVATTASSLEAKQDSGNIAKTQSKATPNESSSLGTTSGGGPKRQETIGDTITQTSLRIIDLVEGSSKQAGDKLEQEVTKKQKVDDVYETTEVDDDSEAAKIKELNWKLFPDEEEK
ncbi:putative ribonuclease H-like domain-containing protein [Tanacetum coccineum]